MARHILDTPYWVTTDASYLVDQNLMPVSPAFLLVLAS